MAVLIAFAFLSGIVTILSPCILPVLPIVLSGSVGGQRRPYGVVTGFVFSFTLFTLTLSAIVRLAGIPADTLRIGAVIIIILFGVVMLFPPLSRRFELLTSRLSSRPHSGKPGKGFTGGFLTGLSLGLVWTPCVGPIMASVISLAVSRSVDGGSVLITIAYSLGTSLPMIAIMAGGRKLINRFPGLSKNRAAVGRVFGVLMIVTGLAIGTGIDRKFQTSMLKIFPSWGSGLTSFEDTPAVRKALSPDTRSENLGPAPPIVTGGEWFNSQPLTMDDLKGKVVIVDFWTYSCINCIRTLPYLKAWYETYKDEGLVIIGVHSPEFAFEKNPDNLRKAIADLGVTWPVVQDNMFLQWRAYNNKYWPAKYFIDKKGNIRYSHFGEGDYGKSEDIIRMLLKEDGEAVGARAPVPGETINTARTGETYLGYLRNRTFVSPVPIKRDGYENYTAGKDLKNGEWTLSGKWAFTKEYIVNDGPASLKLDFTAGDVYLVIEPEGQGELEIGLDGSPVQTLMPDESRHYQVVSLKKPGEHTLELTVKGKMRLFAFTFG